MFGIMRPEGACSNKNDSEYRFHRMHYCGVCKSMGNSYGHKSRLLLNYDSVFLSEMLSELAAEDLEKWENAFQSINKCLTMPKGEAPLSLAYAADANLLLSELKIADQLYDNGTLGWRFVQKFFERPFSKSAKRLQKWGLDKNEILSITEEQQKREEQDEQFDQLEHCIDFYAEPTARLTALIFSNGAKVIEKEALCSSMHDFGFAFGKLAYLLDAFCDLEKDIYKGQFNPLAQFYCVEKSLQDWQKDKIRDLLEEMIQQCSIFLGDILPERAEIYCSRLRSNVLLQSYREVQVPQSFRERLAGRWQHARDSAAKINCGESQNLASKLRYQTLSVAVFIAPKTSEYLGEGRDSSIFSWTAFLAAFLSAVGLGLFFGKKKKEKKANKRKTLKTFKNILNAIRSGYFLKKGCWEEVISLCCAACACGCCEFCCQNGCNGCLNSCDDSRSRVWIWILLAFFIVVIGISALLFFIL